MTDVIAHRGASAYYPENSLEAFEAAVALGADGIELDVHSTADGSILVYHDWAAGGVRLRDARHADLADYRLSNGEPIPTLADALTAIGRDVTVYVEVKGLSYRFDSALFAAIDAAPSPGSIHVHGFDHRVVRRLLDARPGLPAGVLAVAYPVDPLVSVRSANARTLWQDEAYIDRPLLDAAHDNDVSVIAWTVDDERRMIELVEMGIDGICTNTPDVARSVIA